MDFWFALHKLKKFLSNTGKVHFDGFLHLLKYIKYNKNLILKYYSKIEDLPLFDLLIQAIIKSENQLRVLYEYIWQECTDTDKCTGSYIVFYQGGPIDHCKHVTGTV